MDPAIDSVLLVGFGGPTRPDEIMPFLRHVTRNRGVPEQRLLDVAQHYEAVGGRSPYNELTAKQAEALSTWLAGGGRPLPVYVGMRNWHPFLDDTVARMAANDRAHAAAVILAPHRSETSWERYVKDVERAVAAAGGRPRVTFVDPWFDEPGFLEACAQRIEEVTGHRRGAWPGAVDLLFTAHSIPLAMAESSPYMSDLTASCAGVARLMAASGFQIAFQSRSGDPRSRWLEPDICDALRVRAAAGASEVVVHPIGFLSDHVEVLYDLDVEAGRLASQLGLRMRRAACVNSHPHFIAALGRRVRRVCADD